MKKQTIKLIALDLDGTLFNHSGVITPETKKVLKEASQKGISKAKGLSFLCELLSIPPEQTMACGDSENDRDIVTTAHIGVAMANASDDLKACADYICPKTNEEDGVAFAIKELVSL